MMLQGFIWPAAFWFLVKSRSGGLLRKGRWMPLKVAQAKSSRHL